MFPIPPDYVSRMQREATFAARRIVREQGLQSDQLADIRQDLLVELICRCKAFDPTRGTFAAFVELALRHHRSRVLCKITRHRRLFGRRPVSLDDPLPDGQLRSETVPEASGYAAILGHRTDSFEMIEQRLDLQRALERPFGRPRRALP